MFKIHFVRLWHQIKFVPCNSIRLETKSCRHLVDKYYTMVTTCVMHFDILYPFCLYLYSIQWLKKSVDKEYILIYWSSNKNSFDKENWNKKELKFVGIYISVLFYDSSARFIFETASRWLSKILILTFWRFCYLWCKQYVEDTF